MRDIVGAEDVLAGRRETARGVVARGNTLVVRFTRPARNFLARTALPYFCAVPPWLPPSAEGLGVYPSAGPYRITEYRKGDRIEIRRNRFYGGQRRVHVDGFDVNLRGGDPVELLRSIERGDADWAWMLAGVFMSPGLDFEKKYGLNKSRFWMLPGHALRILSFNTSRPLFRNNLRLRQAVNFALDRRALVASSYGPLATPPTDQHLPPGIPGFRNADVYPLDGDLDRARELARGHLRGGKAVLRLHTFGPMIEIAQLVKEQLAKIGLEVEIKVDPGYELTRPAQALHGEWDIGFVIWLPDIPDAHEYLGGFLDAHLQGGRDADSRALEARGAALARAALSPTGRARNRAYAEVDKMIARDLAPVAMLSVLSVATLVSERVDRIAWSSGRRSTSRSRASGTRRLLHRDPDATVPERDPGGGVTDRDGLHHLRGLGIDAGDRAVVRVRDPDRACAERDGGRAVSDRDRPRRGEVQIGREPLHDVVVPACHPDRAVARGDPARGTANRRSVHGAQVPPSRG